MIDDTPEAQAVGRWQAEGHSTMTELEAYLKRKKKPKDMVVRTVRDQDRLVVSKWLPGGRVLPHERMTTSPEDNELELTAKNIREHLFIMQGIEANRIDIPFIADTIKFIDDAIRDKNDGNRHARLSEGIRRGNEYIDKRMQAQVENQPPKRAMSQQDWDKAKQTVNHVLETLRTLVKLIAGGKGEEKGHELIKKLRDLIWEGDEVPNRRQVLFESIQSVVDDANQFKVKWDSVKRARQATLMQLAKTVTELTEEMRELISSHRSPWGDENTKTVIRSIAGHIKDGINPSMELKDLPDFRDGIEPRFKAREKTLETVVSYLKRFVIYHRIRETKPNKKRLREDTQSQPDENKATTTATLDTVRGRSKKRNRQKNIERAIRYWQDNPELIIPRHGFRRMMRDMINTHYIVTQTNKLAEKFRWTVEACDAVQTASEAHVVEMLQMSYEATQHAKRKTLFPKDTNLVKLLRK